MNLIRSVAIFMVIKLHIHIRKEPGTLIDFLQVDSHDELSKKRLI